MSLIERVWRICSRVSGVALVAVATDDERIADAVAGFGGRAVMTPTDCRTGSDRTHAALRALADERLVAAVNVQGDAVLTPPWVVQALVDGLRTEADAPIVTPAVRLSAEQLDAFLTAKRATPASGTTVVCRPDGQALYFSKHVLPFRRTADADVGVFRHIGIYGYRRDALERFAALPTGRLEAAEGLEQLRALEAGIPIRVIEVDYRGRTHWSIDAPADVDAASAIVEREGELA